MSPTELATLIASTGVAIAGIIKASQKPTPPQVERRAQKKQSDASHEEVLALAAADGYYSNRARMADIERRLFRIEDNQSRDHDLLLRIAGAMNVGEEAK